MIGAIISLFNFVRGIFTVGGFVGKFVTWFTGLGGWIVTALIGLGTLVKDFFLGTLVAFKRVATYIAAYHIVELARRFVLVTFITAVFGWSINYIVNNIVVFNGKTISSLFNGFITSINSFGAMGHNLLAFMSKMGIFDSISLFLTVMIYTLMARVALSILFR